MKLFYENHGCIDCYNPCGECWAHIELSPLSGSWVVTYDATGESQYFDSLAEAQKAWVNEILSDDEWEDWADRQLADCSVADLLQIGSAGERPKAVPLGVRPCSAT